MRAAGRGCDKRLDTVDSAREGMLSHVEDCGQVEGLRWRCPASNGMAGVRIYLHDKTRSNSLVRG